MYVQRFELCSDQKSPDLIKSLNRYTIVGLQVVPPNKISTSLSTQVNGVL